MNANRKTIKQFLELVYGDALELPSKHVGLWTLSDQASKFFTSVDEAAAHAGKRASETDVYCCMGLFDAPPASGRGKVEDVTGVCGFWADVDVAHDGAHQSKKKYCPSIEEAKKLVRAFGVQPSFEVRSGYGLHAYWLFNEPWVFGSEREWESGKVLCRRWVATIAAWAKQTGWDIDSTGDIVRVLRVAGTINHKNNTKKLVELDAPEKILRYNPDDLEQFMVAEEFTSAQRVAVASVGAIRLDPAADPPAHKLAALITNDEKFALSWERRRTDFADQSGSAYDMSLSTIAASAGWSDQEIANLLISARRKHSDDLKLRVDYYQRTISKAKTRIEGDRAMQEIVEGGDEAALGGTAVHVDPDARAKILDMVSKAMGIRISRVVKQGKEIANYSLILGDGLEVLIGKSSALMDLRTVRARVYAVADVAVKSMKAAEWLKVCNMFRHVMEHVENPQATYKAQAIGWLRAYVPQSTCFTEEDWARALEPNLPFRRGSHLYVHADSLRKWLRVQVGVSVDIAEIWAGLKLCGFTTETVAARPEGKPVSRSYWKGPEEVLNEAAPEPVEVRIGENQ